MIQYPLLAVLALSLSRSCIEADCGEWSLPDWMYDTFFQAGLNGSLGGLYGMPSKPWSAPTIAAIHARKFRNRMAYRKQEAMRGFSYAVPAWQFPRGGWT